jgi:WD40 repeat protein/serine/threonine protein kinase
MEYVPGVNLKEHVAQVGRLPVKQAVDFILQAARGLAFLHQHQLVHRDIKPSNLLLTANGTIVKVADLGLARLVTAAREESSSTLPETGAPEDLSSILSEPGTVMGTVDFMAPEQGQDAHSVDIRGDLYSLGCTLYYLLTGKVPFPDGTVLEKLHRHQGAEPVPVTQWRPETPAPVAAVVRKLMAKRPGDRYQTPADLAAALDAILTPGSSEQMVPKALTAAGSTAIKWARLLRTLMAKRSNHRYQGPADLTTVLDPSPASGPKEQTVPYKLATTRSTKATWSRILLTRKVGLLMLGLLVPFLIWYGQRELTSQADRQIEESQIATSPRTTSTHRPTTAAGVRPLSLPPGTHQVRVAPPSMVVRPEKPLAAPPNTSPALTEVRGTEEPTELVATLGDPHERGRHRVYCVAFSPTDQAVASAGEDTVVRRWEWVATHEVFERKGHQSPVTSVAFSPDGCRLLSGSEDATARLWDARTGAEVRAPLSGKAAIWSVAFSPDGHWAVTSSGRVDRENDKWAPHDCSLRLWDLQDEKEEPRLFVGHQQPVRCAVFSPDGQRLLSGSGGIHDDGRPVDDTVRLWDVDSGKELLQLRTHQRAVRSVAIFPDGKHAVSGGDDGEVLLWNLEGSSDQTPKPLGKSLPPGTAKPRVLAVAIAPDGKTLAAAREDGRIVLWDEQGHELPDPHWQLPGAVFGLAFASDGRHLATANANGTVYILGIQSKPTSGGTISGKVVLNDLAQPGLDVVLREGKKGGAIVQTVQTDAAGKFLFKDVPPGKYVVASQLAIPKRQGDAMADVKPGKDTAVTIDLKR